MADGEVDIAISFSPGATSNAIEAFELPKTVRTYVPDGGTLGNASFVAIPCNAAHKAAAMVVANFLLSPEAQAHKQDPAVMGTPTVLDVAALPAGQRALFDNLDLGVATLSPAKLGTSLPEPDPSWTARIEREWERRYGVAR